MLLYLLAMFVMPLACSPIIVRQSGKTRQITLLGILILGGSAAAYFLSKDEQITEYHPPKVEQNIRQATGLCEMSQGRAQIMALILSPHHDTNRFSGNHQS